MVSTMGSLFNFKDSSTYKKRFDHGELIQLYKFKYLYVQEQDAYRKKYHKWLYSVEKFGRPFSVLGLPSVS